jgi:hypothetical protein
MNKEYELGPTPVLVENEYPERFYSKENFCHPDKWMGVLKGENGERLNKNVRSKYYPKENKGHIAKTPLHAIRWSILNYTKPGDIVLDPFMGSGTTGVEAMVQNRIPWGVEFEFGHTVTLPTLEHFGEQGKDFILKFGNSAEMLDEFEDGKCALVNLSNPYPDGGDHSTGIGGSNQAKYNKKGNSGLMKSNGEYWDLMKLIQDKSCDKLKIGGHAVFVIKDMMKKKKVWELHRMLAELMPDNMEFIGTFALDHYPRSLFMNTYEDRWGIRPPLEQVCPVFKKIRN